MVTATATATDPAGPHPRDAARRHGGRHRAAASRVSPPNGGRVPRCVIGENAPSARRGTTVRVAGLGGRVMAGWGMLSGHAVQTVCGRLACSAGASRVEHLSLVLGQSAPHAVGLSHRKSMGPTLRQHGTPQTDLLCGDRAPTPRAATLTLRMEEDLGADLAARPAQLPLPPERERTRKSGNLCHCVLREVSPCRLVVDATCADLVNKGREGQELLKNLMPAARHWRDRGGRLRGRRDRASGGSPAHIRALRRGRT